MDYVNESEPEPAFRRMLHDAMDDSSRLSVAQVRSLVSACDPDLLPALLDALESDGRSGVAGIVRSARKRLERETSERNRVRAMYEAAREYGGDGIVVGVDEVGRGSVAGPLTVAAVALPDDPIVWGINDSKKLSPHRREELSEAIRSCAVAIGIAHIPPQDIDACGMAASLRQAMSKAVANTGVSPDAVLIDGLPVHIHPKEIAIVHGDARISCIAAASIVAKVTRDAIMVEADARYPGYDFAVSKGYASPEHIRAIRERGLTDFHRETFCHNFLS